MGTLHYDGVAFDFNDRLLAHLQIIIGTKLRRGENFFMTWQPDAHEGQGRHAIWIDNGVPIHIAFSGSRFPTINRLWVEAMATSANSVSGLLVTSEVIAPVVPPSTLVPEAGV